MKFKNTKRDCYTFAFCFIVILLSTPFVPFPHSGVLGLQCLKCGSLETGNVCSADKPLGDHAECPLEAKSCFKSVSGRQI